MQNIVKQFEKRYKQQLENTQHNSPYHLEGDVWTHTMMVYQEAQKTGDYIMMITALLHDIGKPEAKTKRLSGGYHFGGHAGISVFKAIDFLKNIVDDDQTLLEILYIISYHDHLMQRRKENFWTQYFSTPFTNYLLERLQEFNILDRAGSISKIEQQPQEISVEITKEDFVDEDANITLLIGPPGSGKTTWIRENNIDATIISRDQTFIDILSEKYGTADYRTLWNIATKEDHAFVDKTIREKYKIAKQRGDQIVIDMTNMTIKSRRKWLDSKNTFKYIVFLTDYEELIKRLKSRKHQRVSVGTLIRLLKYFEMPLPSEANIQDILYVFNDRQISLKETINNHFQLAR